MSDSGEVADKRSGSLRSDQRFKLLVEEARRGTAARIGLLRKHLPRVLEIVTEMAAQLLGVRRRRRIRGVGALEVGEQLDRVLAQLRARALFD